MEKMAAEEVSRSHLKTNVLVHDLFYVAAHSRVGTDHLPEMQLIKGRGLPGII